MTMSSFWLPITVPSALNLTIHGEISWIISSELFSVFPLKSTLLSLKILEAPGFHH